MSLPKSTSYQNGQTPASPKLGEAFVSTEQLSAATVVASSTNPNSDSNGGLPQVAVRAQPQTVFPEDRPSTSLRTLLYGFTHHYFAGITLFRWAITLLIVLIIVGLIAGPLPWAATLIVGIVAIIALLLWRRILQQKDFVRFEVEHPSGDGLQSVTAGLIASTVTPARQDIPPLDPTEKIPVHVTGLFAVEGREERFTWVPGFYRTFATREHALLCQVQNRRFLAIAESDLEMVGMWYIFFRPEEIVGLRCGQLYFGGTPRPAIAVDHQVEVKATRRFKRDKTVLETIYISLQDDDQRRRIWADLNADLD